MGSKVGAVIVAAGSSSRMGGVDKVFAPVGGRPLLTYAVEAFERSAAVDAIVIVMRPDSVREGERLARDRGWHKVVAFEPGGSRRQDSVLAGLNALSHSDWVMVHDGARPCVTGEIIERGLESARETGAAIAAVPAKDTIKVVGEDGRVRETPPRERLWQVQTPQVFRYEVLRHAYATNGEAEVTDDAALVERSGKAVKVFMGAYENIKVTTPEDLAVAEALLSRAAEARR